MTLERTREVSGAEAKWQLDKMVAGVDAFFSRGGVGRRCPAIPQQVGGTVGPTPSTAVDCNQGPGGRCIPAPGGGTTAVYYPSELWSDDAAWKEIGFAVEQGHRFHYSYTYDNSPEGACTFTVAATADLDADGTWSRFWMDCTRSGGGLSCGELQSRDPLE